MKFLLCLLSIMSVMMNVGCDSPVAPSPVPVPTISPTPAPIPTPSPSPDPTPSPTPTPLDVDALFDASDADRAEVRGYVEYFVVNSGIADAAALMAEPPKLLIQIASLDAYGAGVIGLCETYGTSYRVLTLDPDYFNIWQDPISNQILVSHELGHCVLYRGHTSAFDYLPPDSTYHEASIMYPIIMPASQYAAHEEYYLAELYALLAYDGRQSHVWVCPSRSHR